ncbi:MAG: mandelate racemase/muconate lactonizing enzyme family protein [Cyclobacteriaceae bacterium]|nr:mandelate racemase/muconate lactonizing enzyme family protein [Cyclobacteriaceae bacterium HetDA_MAG_MS6]
MSRRRQFLQKLSLGAGALSMTSLPVAGVERHVQQAEIEDVKKYIKIKEIRQVKLRFPGKIPHTWNATKTYGGGSPSTKYMEVITDQGIVGRTFFKGSFNMIEGDIFGKVEGQNLMNTEQVWYRMYNYKRKPLAKGEYIRAMGSMDLAIWDIIGKALNLPTYKVLGAFREEIPVYGAGGYYAEGKTIADLVKEMEGLVDEGFKVVKMKVGGASFNEDVERVKAVREALGFDIGIMLDANNGFRTYEAIQFGRSVEKFRPYWFEEPVVNDNYEGAAEIRAALDMPIVMGENEYTKWGVRDMIQGDAVDILNVDTHRAGGYTEYRKIAGYADAHHIPVAPHGHSMMAVHLMASIPNGLIMEVYPKSTALWSSPAFPPPEVIDGKVTVPSTPGLGLEPDPDIVRKYKV